MYTFQIQEENTFGKYPCQVLKDNEPITVGTTGLTSKRAKSLYEYYIEEYLKQDAKKAQHII